MDAHIGVAMSGLTADARTLIDHGRVEAQQHAFTYNEPIPVESLTQVLIRKVLPSRPMLWCRFIGVGQPIARAEWLRVYVLTPQPHPQSPAVPVRPVAAIWRG